MITYRMVNRCSRWPHGRHNDEARASFAIPVGSLVQSGQVSGLRADAQLLQRFSPLYTLLACRGIAAAQVPRDGVRKGLEAIALAAGLPSICSFALLQSSGVLWVSTIPRT